MKRQFLVLMAAIIAACGAPAPESEHGSTLWYSTTPEEYQGIELPGQEGRLDGSPWTDGMFRTEDARAEACAMFPDAAFCHELGTTRQAWRAAETHGISDQVDGACYGPAAPNGSGDCIFPEMKHFRIVKSNSGCYDGAAPPNGPSILQEEAIIFGIIEGMKAWTGLGGSDCGAPGQCSASIVVDNGVPGTDWYAPVTVNCEVPDNSAYATGGLAGALLTRVGNLPVGAQTGKDQDDGYVIRNGYIWINVQRIWAHAAITCGGGANVSTQKLREFVWSIGAHEMGHVLGFAHFLVGGDLANNVMYPWRSPGVCLQDYEVLPAFAAAIGYLHTPASGGVTISAAQGVWAQQPQ